MMKLGFWQQFVIGTWVFHLFIAAILHGKPKVKRDGTPLKFKFEDAVISVLINFIVLYFGGFFK